MLDSEEMTKIDYDFSTLDLSQAKLLLVRLPEAFKQLTLEAGTDLAREAREIICRAVSDWIPERQVIVAGYRGGESFSFEGLNLAQIRDFRDKLAATVRELDDFLAAKE